MLTHPAGEEQRGHHRNDGDRQDQRAGHRRHEGEGHRPEHLALDALQAEDRQEDDDHDQPGEHDRRANLPGGLFEHREWCPAATMPPLVGRDVADGIFDHHHRPIDDHPEVNRSEAHQVGGDAGDLHGDQSRHRRKRDGRRHNQPRPDVAQ